MKPVSLLCLPLSPSTGQNMVTRSMHALPYLDVNTDPKLWPSRETSAYDLYIRIPRWFIDLPRPSSPERFAERRVPVRRLTERGGKALGRNRVLWVGEKGNGSEGHPSFRPDVSSEAPCPIHSPTWRFVYEYVKWYFLSNNTESEQKKITESGDEMLRSVTSRRRRDASGRVWLKNDWQEGGKQAGGTKKNYNVGPGVCGEEP